MMYKQKSIPVISRNCHDPQFVKYTIDRLAESYSTGIPDFDIDAVFSEMLKFNQQVQKEMTEDLYTALSVFKEMLRNEARGKPR